MTFRTISIEIDALELNCGLCRYKQSEYFGTRDGWRLDCSIFDWSRWNRNIDDMERAPKCIQAEAGKGTKELEYLLVSCRSSVNLDCQQYERMQMSGVKPLYEQIVEQEANRLFALRDAIDNIAEQVQS